ncbi:MAG: AMP-binding protein [Candidatus Brocadiia bacterium]|jgi:long-chain acyl-CoA synthetase|nr:AMP-binding protein [Candidatus Brocadiia bacterium]
MPYGWLRDATQRQPDRVALVHAGVSVTYGELLRATRAMIGVLREWGIEPGDHVATQMAGTPEYVAALCAVDGAGAALLPLDPTLKAGEVDAYCQRAGVRLVVVEPDKPGEQSPGGVPRRAAPCLVELARMQGLRPEDEGPWPPEAARYVLMLMSSGTTGRPKIVPRTRRELHGALRVENAAMPLREEDRLLGALPLFHGAGLFKALLGCLTQACTLYLQPFSPRGAVRTIEREGITVLKGAPLIYRSLAETEFSALPRLGTLRLATSGTAMQPRQVAQVLRRKFGVRLTIDYGSTEAATATAGLPLADDPGTGWVGRPLPGVTVEVWGADGERLPAGQEGQVVVKSPGAASCYLDDPEATASTFREGFVLTGDIGYRTPGGDLHLVGRQKEMISVAGKKVSPAEVEDVLRQHPQVSEALVMPEREADGDEVVSAYVECVGELTPGILRTFCAERLAPFKAPRRVKFVDRLPRSATGKVLRRAPDCSKGGSGR